MVRAAFFSDEHAMFQEVYGEGRRKHLESILNFYPKIITSENFENNLKDIRSIEFIFSTWGMPRLNVQQIGQLPELKVVFYAAGSVKYFAEPFLKRGIKVVSAWGANAIPVAEYTVAQIILAAKGFFTCERACRNFEGRLNCQYDYPGNFDLTVSLLGAGMIGRLVIKLLKPFNMNILVFDPFLSNEQARELGVSKVSLKQAVQRGFVVSNHLADLPETKNLITKEIFQLLPEKATFINTGRGATVDEKGMLEVLEKRCDLTALLDVTCPEPSERNNPIFNLDNVILTPHIAGSIGRERLRMADFMIEEYQCYAKNQPLKYSVTLDQLNKMA